MPFALAGVCYGTESQTRKFAKFAAGRARTGRMAAIMMVSLAGARGMVPLSLKLMTPNVMPTRSNLVFARVNVNVSLDVPPARRWPRTTPYGSSKRLLLFWTAF